MTDSMRRRLHFPITRHVLASALIAFVQAIADPPQEQEPFAVGGYL